MLVWGKIVLRFPIHNVLDSLIKVFVSNERVQIWYQIVVCQESLHNIVSIWWRLQMEAFSALLAICAGNSPVPRTKSVTRSCDVFFDLRLNKRLSKQWWGWWFQTTSRPLWRHCNELNWFARFYICNSLALGDVSVVTCNFQRHFRASVCICR